MAFIKAEVITIGDEILYGQITDTNTQFISTELDKIGIKTVRKSSVGDDEQEILNIFQEASSRADLVIITGGLGPTKDDITKKTICRFFDDELIINEHALAFLVDFFEKRNRPMIETNRMQALIPSKATYLPNAVGTAPGMWLEQNKTVFVSLPGVPSEMKYLIKNEVLPRLKEHFQTPIIFHKMIRTIGVGESFLAQRIEAWEDALPSHLKLAYLPSFGQVRLRITALGNDEETLKREVQEQVEKLMPLIEEDVFGFDNTELEQAIGQLLLKNKATLSIAESCTGGYLSHLITKVAGCSAYYKGSVTAYSNEVKEAILGVKYEILEKFGVVSEQVVKQMADGIREKLKTTYSIATTGVAGPDGGSEEKPVGTVWIAVSSHKGTVAFKLHLTTQRETNIQYASVAALNVLRKQLMRKEVNV